MVYLTLHFPRFLASPKDHVYSCHISTRWELKQKHPVLRALRKGSSTAPRVHPCTGIASNLFTVTYPKNKIMQNASKKRVFLLGTLCEMVTFFFFSPKGNLSSCLPGYYSIRVASLLSTLQDSTNIKALEQWKMTVKIMWDVTLAVLSNVSHSFRATWVCSQQSCFITWQDKDYKAFRKQPEMGEPFLNYLGTISVPRENLF